MYDTLFSQLNDETLVLTVNQRLASTLSQHYKIFKQRMTSTWRTPSIYPLSVWLEQQWNTLVQTSETPFPLLLNLYQIEQLWRQIIKDSKGSSHLLNITEASQLAMSAWQLLQEWQCPLSPHDCKTENHRQFIGWFSHFERERQKKQWITPSNLINELLNRSDLQYLTPIKHIFFVGFDQISPQQNILQNAFKKLDIQCHEIMPQYDTTSVHRQIFANEKTEFEAMADWANQQITANPNHRVGCIVPALKESWSSLIDVFEKITAYKNPQFKYQISAGLALIEYPLIHDALLLLKLNKKSLAWNDITYLISSPFIGEAETEYTARMQFKQYLRSIGEPHFSAQFLLKQLSRFNEKQEPHLGCPQLLKRLTAFFQIKNPKHQPATVWATYFIEKLKTVGWPGERTLTSTEYQLQHRFQKLCVEFYSIEIFHPTLDHTVALEQLNNLATSTLFQPESKTSHVHIVGSLESSGLLFDTLWICGMDDVRWPTPAKPNPYLPLSLQIQHHLPHANALREYHYCQQLTHRFMHAAPDVIFSHATSKEDEIRSVSPLISTIPLVNSTENGKDHLLASDVFEYVSDEKAPPILNEIIVKGGANVIKHQINCPFRAFAEFRLFTRSADPIHFGFSPKERGNLLHQILERIWQTLRTQETLINTTATTLNELIQTHIQIILEQQQKKRPSLSKEYLTLEKQRLLHLINRWLQLEKERPAFSIIACEEKHAITFGNLTLTCKIDRIDELAHGERIILDYKTGVISVADWFNEQPHDPQMPLYALIQSIESQAILFAQLKPNQITIQGISEHDLGIKGVEATIKKYNIHWEDLKTRWLQAFSQHAEDFLSGYAAILPKEKDKTCKQCHLPNLCRIHEQTDHE